jgi:hypothetical protein
MSRSGAWEDPVVRAGEPAQLDRDVIADDHPVDIDARVREGLQPDAEELEGRGLALEAQPPGAVWTTSSDMASPNPSRSWALKVSMPRSKASRMDIVM